MNYIKRLENHAEQTKHGLNEVQERLTDINVYLASPKFQGIENNWVSASEMSDRIREISNMISQIQ